MRFLIATTSGLPTETGYLRQAIEQVPAHVAWIFGDTQEITDAGVITQYAKFGLSVAEAVRVVEDPLSVQYPWQIGPLQSSIIKREALLELNCFSENLKTGEDLLAGIQVACRYGSAAVPEIVTKWYRTPDLAASSLAFATISRANSDLCAEYFRAGMEAFSLAARTVRRQPWGELYADAVRGMCKERSRKGESFRRLSFQQFRYGVSCKSVAFFCAAILGRAGLSLWSKATSVGGEVFSRFPGASGIASNELRK